MALTWITQISNATNAPIFLKQTDPSRNPVIDEVESGAGWTSAEKLIAEGPGSFSKQAGKPAVHQWFAVAPKTVLRTSWFIVPWANTSGFVYLFVNLDGKPVADIASLELSGAQFQIVPDGGGKNDYLQFFDRDLNPVLGTQDSILPQGEFARIPVGPAGAAANTSGRLIVTPKSVTYTATESNSAGGDFVTIVTGIGEVALAVAAIYVTAGAAGGVLNPGVVAGA